MSIPQSVRAAGARADKNRLGIRKHIAAVAKQQFARKGFENVRLCDIARAADVPGVEMVIHFSSKAHLLRAILEDAWATLVPQFEDFINTPVAARRILLSMQSLMSEFARKDTDMSKLLAMEGRQVLQGAKESEYSKGRRQFQKLCGDLVARGHKDGSFPASYRAAAAAAAVTSVLNTDDAKPQVVAAAAPAAKTPPGIKLRDSGELRQPA